MLSFNKLGQLLGVAIGRGDSGKRILSCTASEATTEAMDKKPFAGGSLIIPSDSPVTSVAFYGNHDLTGTYLPLYDENQQAVSFSVAAGQIHTLPDALYGVPYFKIVTNAADDLTVFFVG